MTTNERPKVAAYSDQQRPTIELSEVSSGQVRAIGYDPQTKTLAVQFRRGGGAIYHYPDVEPKEHQDFLGASSIGSYFDQHFKRRPFTKYHPDPEPQAEDKAQP